MDTNELISKRFQELEREMRAVRLLGSSHEPYVDSDSFHRWATSALNLLERVLGENSAHARSFRRIFEEFSQKTTQLDSAQGIFKAAKADYDGGYVFDLEARVSGEIFGDFVLLAKRSLKDGYKDVAAVLACAALEDALKKFATLKGLDVSDRSMQDVVAAIKSKGLVGGAQKALLDAMPKIRDYAMHANWVKITPEDVNSVIGFVEQFLVSRFS